MEKENFEKFVDNYNIEDDPIYQDFMKSKANRTGNTKITYKKTLVDFCNANQMQLYDIYKICKKEQRDRVVDEEIINFDPDDINTFTKHYFNNFLAYIKINKSPYKTNREENRGRTINLKVALLKSFFKKYKLVLPEYEKADEDDSKDWKPLSKKDIEYIVNDSTLEQTALWSFMMSTGMRESDCVNLKIRDFMEATTKMGYHNYVNVDDFIDNAPQDMIGFWEFMPQKTKKDRIQCMTFNNRESSNYILQSLRKIKNDYLPRHNKKYGKDLKISKDSPLFGSRTYHYLGHRKPNSITQAAHKKNKKLREHYMTQIEEKIKKGEIGEEDKEKYIADIPVFHGHQLRRYFINTIRKYATNLSYSAIMEGHAPLMSNDPSYVKITKEDLVKIYDKAIYELSLFEIDADAIFDSKSDELRQEWEEKEAELKETIQERNEEILDLKNKLEEHQNSQQTTNKEVADLKETVKQLSTRLTHLDNNKPLDVDKKQAINTFLMEKSTSKNDNPTKLEEKLATLTRPEKIGLSHIAYELVEYDPNFENNDKYLSKIIKKALREWKRNPILMEKVNAHHELINERERKWKSVQIKIDEKLASDGFWEDDEIDEIHEKILYYLRNNPKEFEQNEITNEYIDELIDKFA